MHQSQTVDRPLAPLGKATQQSDKQSKATSSLFAIKMIAKLEWTQSNTLQSIELQLQNPTMGSTINNVSTTKEPPPYNGQQR